MKEPTQKRFEARFPSHIWQNHGLREFIEAEKELAVEKDRKEIQVKLMKMSRGGLTKGRDWLFKKEVLNLYADLLPEIKDKEI